MSAKGAPVCHGSGAVSRPVQEALPGNLRLGNVYRFPSQELRRDFGRHKIDVVEYEIGSSIYQYKKRVKFNHPNHAHFLTFSCHQRKPFLKSENCCEWLGASIRKSCDKHQFSLWAYVFMPEHVHLLVFPNNQKYDIGEFLHSVKLPVARRAITKLKNEYPDFLRHLSSGDGYRFWLPGGGFDSNLWTWKFIIQKAEYCHNNPVKRGLVSEPQQWKWSSYSALVQNKPGPLKVDEWRDS
jgi:putative transposase